MPGVSVVLPIYNVEKYIRKCLESLVSQTFSDFEVICVDDCGIDSSMQIVNEFVETDSRFKVVKHLKNRGLSAARNTGIDNAKGQYIVFVDSDDWVNVELLAKIVGAFEQNDVKSVWFNALIHQNSISQIYSLNNDIKQDCLINLSSDNINDFASYAWNKAFRLSDLKYTKIRFPEGLYFEDSEFYYKIFSHFSDIYFIAEPLYHYQLRENSIVTGSKDVEKKFEDMFQITVNLYNYFIEMGTFEQNKKMVLQYFAANIISLKVKKHGEFIANVAKKVLKEIDFPDSYKDLDVSNNFYKV